MKNIMATLMAISIILSGCTFGDPESYTLLLFDGESESWELYMEYVDFSEGRHSGNLIEITHKEKSVINRATLKVKGTNIIKEISFEESNSAIVKINDSELSQLIESKKNEDNYIQDAIEVEIIWEDKTEVIPLFYHTAVRRDGRNL